MKNRIIILLFVALTLNGAFSQNIVDKSADSGLMVRQIPNSESDAIEFFSNLPIDADTIYATIFRPANCPRCDGFLNSINSLIKTETTKPSVLIAVYPDSIVAQDYIKRYDLKSDYYIYDIKEDFSKFLSFSPGYLHVGYILKFNKKTGELIVGANADNVSPDFFKGLNIYSKRKEQVKYRNNEIDCHTWNDEDVMSLSLASCSPIVSASNDLIISDILYQPVYQDNKLLLNDKLAMAVIEFEKSDSCFKMKRIVEPDSAEFSQFVNIPKARYDKLLKSNQLKNIPLQPFIMEGDKYGIAYSLPELWIDDDNGLNYRNKPCFIERSFVDADYKRLVPLEYDFNDIFYYPHFNMKWAGKNNVVVGVQRITWPMITDKNEYLDTPENNPFCEQFYNISQPTLATYRQDTGLMEERFGEIPSFARKTKTGYCYSDMVFDYWDDEAVYASAYGGYIVVTTPDNLNCNVCNRTYSAFVLDDSIFETPDTTDYYTYRCNMLAEPYLNRKLVDVKMDDRFIHCLLRHCTDAFERPDREEYQYVVIDRGSGLRKTYSFPNNDDGERRVTYGLKRNVNGKVQPFYISKVSRDFYLREFGT